jgi:uncharacterized protein YaiL (DUF2058 family)
MRLTALLLCAAMLQAEDWRKLNAGPFEIYTTGDIRAAKILLGTLEQLRGQISALTGATDPKPIWPIRIVIDKGQRTAALTETAGVYSLLLGDADLSAEAKRQIAGLILEQNTGPLEPQLNQALLTVLGTLTSSGARVTIGAPPSQDLQTPDWVLMNYLITNDFYRGRIRVFLGNLSRGTDKATALRNGFEKNEDELRKEADAARASFAPVTYAALPILPERDYRARDIEPPQGRLQLALAQLTNGNMRDDARRSCATLAASLPEAQECVAAAYALAGQADLAAQEAEKALANPPPNPRMLYLAAIGQPDRLKHQQHLFAALQLKKLYPDAALAFAGKENSPQKAFQALKDASAAAQRSVTYQSALARWAQKAELPLEESKAWANAERAAFDPARKEELHQARLAAQDRRYEAEEQARREAEEAKRRDIERVRQESLRRVREAEAKARGQLTPLPEGTKVEEWWEGEAPKSFVVGALIRTDCVQNSPRVKLTLRNEAMKLFTFDVPDLTRVIMSGKGASGFQFKCGAQKSPTRFKAGHTNMKLLTLEILP